LAMSFASQKTRMKMKNSMMNASRWIKPTMGAIFIAVGLMIITGLMVVLEEAMLTIMPIWLNDFIYQF
ncbi:hypothetical protein MNBD_GAMMA03-202, partial [hydrothermal vent metagenome]